MAFFRDESRRTLLLMSISLVSLLVSFFDLGRLPVDAAWVAILLCGTPIVKGAVVGLVTEFDIKADVLVSLALIASVIIGEIFAAGEVAFIMTIGAYMEDRTVAKAREGIEKLVRLTPTTARVVTGSEKEAIIPADEVQIGDTLRVLAGETIPVDGIIISGNTSIDQSIMTGEPLPVDKCEGDSVQSGTVNQLGSFDMRAEKVGEDSSLQRMIRLVESADADKAKIVGLADRWATWIVVIALVAAVGTWAFTGEVIRAVTILVVFCPCALVLATPTAIMAGIGNATKYGILVSQGDALERLSQVKRIAFDKTGTLTYGKPSVAAAKSFASDISDSKLLQLAATAELRSEHPLGKAIVTHYRQQADVLPAQPDDFKLLPGRGVYAKVSGMDVYAGNESLLAEKGVTIPRENAEIDAAKQQGCTIIYMMESNGTNSPRSKHASHGEAITRNGDGSARMLGFIALSDTIRPDAASTVAAIHGTGISTLLLTGDTEQAAEHMAGMAGIKDVQANCLPEHKLEAIRGYQNRGGGVCMVGDGINDAPALKAAHVGIAMGGVGSDIAIEAADIALVGDDIQHIPHLLRLSRRVMRTINFNLAASMLLNFVAIGLAITGLLDPVVGALVHNVGSVVVIVNSSLLLKWKSGEASTDSPVIDLNRSHAPEGGSAAN